MATVNYIGGLPVLIDNAYLDNKNGTINDYKNNEEWFITGFFDSGNSSSKIYQYNYYVPNDIIDNCSDIRFFNDTTVKSVDYWTNSSPDTTNNEYIGSRIITSQGRYIATSIKKSMASRSYIYCKTTNEFIMKGDEVDDMLIALAENRSRIMTNQPYSIGGLKVLRDNKVFKSRNGTLTTNIDDSNNYFITGFYDTGSATSKTYTLHNPHSVAGTLKLFDDINSTSVDWWGYSVHNRTLNSVGQYVTFDVYKPLASTYYVYNNTDHCFVAKGKDVIEVTWNNFQPPFSTQYYQPYNSNLVTIEDVESNVIKQTFLTNSARTYHTSVRAKNEYEPTVYASHIYYVSYMIYTPMEHKHFGIECFGGLTFDFGEIPTNQWTRVSFYSNGARNGSGFAYFGNLRSPYPDLDGYTLLKSPIYIDLTLMFGAGNEPTKIEFENQCNINGIDLTLSKERNITGTKRGWALY